ncbi:DNA cytosine methyltransferase [Roseovarius nitratireducens]|uniref:DNA cytosine methyltransferase n=1 Tax=Roseovarius nitratireducens TaxID=2044597 RepID=UPI000CE20FA0|nr:DNA cytosine methyltransferase [Roseovarius nitratireducens]
MTLPLRNLDTPPAAPPVDPRPPMIIDSFAGGGGASTGIEMALGRGPDVAINHDPVALAMHEVNHPETRHLINSIYAIDPRDVVSPGRRVGLAWFSPDCKHHSKAKGGKPVEKNIRDLAWIVVHWAELVRPDVIMLENVEEFQDWCPLTPDNRPDITRRGETFREWVRRLRRLGYKVEWRQLRACDYGAPTIRKRLFVIARRDGRPIIWPEPTHGAPDSAEVIAGARHPWRTAAEIIDWSLPCPSIFDTSAEIMAKHGLRAVRPLKDATLRRIARGVMRYVVEAKQPFVVTCNHSGENFRGQGLDEPFKTLTATRDAHGLVVPTLVQTGYGERPGQQPRVPGLDKPLGTLVAGGGKHALVAAFLAQHNAGARMEKNAGRPATEPLSTLTTRGTQQQVVAASLMNMHGTSRRSASIDAPHPTLTAGGQHGAIIAAFLQKYYGQGLGQDADGPLHTLGTRDTFGLVTVEIDGQTYAITDIGMRMLTPREQFRAQGFPDSYIIDRAPDGRPMTKTEQTRMCGNSVCPPLAMALVKANCEHLRDQAEIEATLASST